MKGGFYEIPKRIKITELAEQLGLARATISEHLTKIEGILMDDMFSSMTDVRLTVEQARTIVETMEADMNASKVIPSENYISLMQSLTNSDGVILTDELGRLLSPDRAHLTRYGAIYVGREIVMMSRLGKTLQHLALNE